MRDINRRISTIEKKLNVGNEQVKPRVIRVCSAVTGDAERALPENVEEWLTYKEQLREYPNTPCIVLYTWDEVKAREQQKATKGQGNECKKTN